MDSLPIDQILTLISLGHFIAAWFVFIGSFLFYKLFLKTISAKRHASMADRFRKTFSTLTLATLFSMVFWPLFKTAYRSIYEVQIIQLANFLALFALLFSSIAIIYLSQVLVYLYLFYRHLKTGVPRLIANIVTIIVATLVTTSLLTQIFHWQLSTLMATSAVFSVVLGLAMQDTLGNLFAGIALQLDHPFKIGDWVEVHQGSERTIGQVFEMSWRATTLFSFSEEMVIIPNRVLNQGPIHNLSGTNSRAVRLSQLFRFEIDTDINLAKKAMREGAALTQGLAHDPPIRILAIETTESWLAIKLFYSLDDYSARYRVADQLLTNIMEALKAHHVSLANAKIQLVER